MRILMCPLLGTAVLARERLVAEGFHPAPVDRSGSVWSGYGSEQVFWVEVPDAEAPEARELLAALGHGEFVV